MISKLTRSLLVAGLLATASLAPTASFAADEVNVARGATVSGPGLAVRGYDVVSYFAGSPVVGSDKFAVAHESATYRFASQANLDTFKANPAKYLPAYGGFCAYGAALGKKFDGDPQFWKVVDGRLYLNLNGDIQSKWNEDIPGNLKKSETNWTKIRSTAVDKL